MSQATSRPLLALIWAGLALLFLGAGSQPQQFIAEAQVLLPAQAGGASRIRTIRHGAGDPISAARMAELELREAVAGNSIVLDETRVGAESERRWLLAPGLVFLALLVNALRFARARSRRVPDRAAVREAVMLAQRGHKSALVDDGSGFRVVLADNAPDREDLKVLARLAGGARVLARRG